jgi:AcrR family transcriptional regulator
VSATKVSDVCESADVALQTFFNHFGSKDDLVHELVAQGYDFVVASVEEAHREGVTTGDRIARLFARILDATTGTGPMHHELLVEAFCASHADANSQGESRIQQAIGRLVRAGIANGEVTRRHRPEDLVRLVYGALNILMFEWANSPDYPIARNADRMARLLADALAPAAAAKASRRERRH